MSRIKNEFRFISLKDKGSRAVTVADFYHRGGNGPSTGGGAVLCIFVYIKF